jgi:fluoride ion exporter CrcB/FEX
MTMTLASTPRTGRRLAVGGRIAGAALTAWSAGIHLYLWFDGFRYIETIGPLFLLNAIGGFVLALVLLLTPERFLTVAFALGALYAAGVLGALTLSLTVGLFGLHESLDTDQVVTTLAVNSVAVVVLGVLTAVRLRQRRQLLG